MASITVDKFFNKTLYAGQEVPIYSYKGFAEAEKYGTHAEILKKVIPITKLPKGSIIGNLRTWTPSTKNPTRLWYKFYTMDNFGNKNWYMTYKEGSSNYHPIDFAKTVKEYGMQGETEEAQYKKQQEEKKRAEEESNPDNKSWLDKLIEQVGPVAKKVGTAFVIVYAIKQLAEYQRDSKAQRRIYN